MINVTNVIRVLEPGKGEVTAPHFYCFNQIYIIDGTERQVIKDTDQNIARPRIRYCSISDPYVLIIREDDSIGLFIGENERGKIRRKDMSPMGDKVLFTPLSEVNTLLICVASFRHRDTYLGISIQTQAAFSRRRPIRELSMQRTPPRCKR